MKFYIFFILTLSIYSCSEKTCLSTSEIELSNTRRRKLSIPIIDTNWIKKDCMWFHPNFLENIAYKKAFYFSKELVFEKGKLVMERDKYRSGKTFKTKLLDKDSIVNTPETVIIQYTYDKDKPWDVYIALPEYMGWAELEDAEELLVGWGVNRLNW